MTGVEIATATSTTLSMLASRATHATLCPSEVARALMVEHKGDWRAAMPVVHAAVDSLLHDGTVRLSWKGERMEVRSGPYRIGSIKGRS